MSGDTKRKSESLALGLKQTSAIVSPRYFKAAHSVEGACSEKFIRHLFDSAESESIVLSQVRKITEVGRSKFA